MHSRSHSRSASRAHSPLDNLETERPARRIARLTAEATAYANAANYEMCEETMSQAIALVATARRETGSSSPLRRVRTAQEHSELGLLYSNLSQMLKKGGKMESAEKYAHAALLAAKEDLGKEHLEVAAYLSNLGLVFKAQGRLADAEACMQHACDIFRAHGSEDEPHLALCFCNLAVIYADRGKIQPAQAATKHSLKILRRILGEGHPSTQAVREHARNLERGKWHQSADSVLASNEWDRPQDPPVRFEPKQSVAASAAATDMNPNSAQPASPSRWHLPWTPPRSYPRESLRLEPIAKPATKPRSLVPAAGPGLYDDYVRASQFRGPGRTPSPTKPLDAVQ